jgi:cysteine-rich repeat protein
MPMRFAAVDGTLIDVYQAATQMTDESGQSYPYTIDTLLDRALGPDGYFGVFTANMHTDGASGSIAGANAIVASAQARGVPVVSGRQMLEWLDGRNASTFANLQPVANGLEFDVARNSAARNLMAYMPASVGATALTSLTRDGAPVAWTTETLKGDDVALFAAETGHYVVSYGADTSPPVITNLVATPGPGDAATISWTTNEPADSRVDFGTDPGALAASVSSPTLVTSHSIDLTGLLAGTTYYFRATSADAAANATSDPPSLGAPASFGTAALVCASDVTQSDFAAGAPGTGIVVTPIGDGALALAASVDEAFDGSSLPAGWFETAWSAGGDAVVAGGSLAVDGALSGTNATFGSGHSLEFSATFESVPLQHVGFAETLNAPPWAIFSTGISGTSLQARTNGASALDTSLPGVALGVPHRFRIDWSASSVDFFVDGSPVASHPIAIATPQSVLASDLAVDGTSVAIDWLRMSPYDAAGVFESRVFDAGTPSGWDAVSWSSEVGAGTGLSVAVRAGDTPVPDGSWSDFVNVVASGASGGVVGRYVQYRVDLTSAVSSATPVLHDLSLSCSPLVLCGNTVLDGNEECDDGNGLAGDGCSPSCLFESLDADGDGLTNVEEQGLGTNPLKADTDGDGISDGDEVAAGTNPLDKNDPPPTIPSLAPWALAFLVLGLMVFGVDRLRRRRAS